MIGLPGILFVLFLALKLTGVIAWSWVWVFAPIWVTAVVTLLVMAGLAGFAYWAAKNIDG